ncbi:WIAG-tail domain [Paenibacillus sp. NPDC058174]|uniref:WIAG-tail domain n=1 Tax=Paenibacillus sp. NPDC058174 TaxID=3346366 RepID=UPI0036DD8403
MLTFNPVIAPASAGTVKQQFGLSPYSFTSQRDQLDIIIKFDESFENDAYVVTATSDHPACYAVVRSKTVNSVVIGLIRTRISDEPNGFINWIAIGR